MAWQNPKTNWNPGDGIMAGDLNRIEGNLEWAINNVYDCSGFAQNTPSPNDNTTPFAYLNIYVPSDHLARLAYIGYKVITGTSGNLAVSIHARQYMDGAVRPGLAYVSHPDGVSYSAGGLFRNTGGFAVAPDDQAHWWTIGLVVRAQANAAVDIAYNARFYVVPHA